MGSTMKRASAGLLALTGVSAWLSYTSVRTEAVGIFGPAGGSATLDMTSKGPSSQVGVTAPAIST